jgi:hypothetical protein
LPNEGVQKHCFDDVIWLGEIASWPGAAEEADGLHFLLNRPL